MSTAETQQDSPASRRGTISKGALDNLPSRARTTNDEAAARSRMVRRLRIALPVVGLVLLAAFVFSTSSRQNEPVPLDIFKTADVTAEEYRMESPKFSGIDKEGRPFEITAAAASRDPAAEDIVQLEQPRAIQGDAGDTNVVTADRGVYQSETKLLELSENVTLEHEMGAKTYIFRAPAALVTIEEELVTSDAGIGGEGPDGETLTADRMTAYNAEGRVVLEGNVRMRIYPKSQTQSGDAEEPAAPELKDININTPE